METMVRRGKLGLWLMDWPPHMIGPGDAARQYPECVYAAREPPEWDWLAD